MVKRIIAICFLISGIAGILYQVLWIRLLSLAFGGVTVVVAGVASIFLLGLSLGAYIGGRLADFSYRKNTNYIFRFYFVIEVLTAVLGVVCWKVFYSLAYTSGEWRYYLAAGLLLTQTLIMGATWPAMFKILLGLGSPWRIIGRVSFLNTLGAAGGAFLASFLLIANIGLTGSLYLALLLNFAAGGGVLLVSFLGVKKEINILAKEDAKETNTRLLEGNPVFKVYLALFIGGFVGMSLEIFWMRTFGLIIGSSIYAFSLVLTIILLGLAFGGLVVEKVKSNLSFNSLKTLLLLEALFLLVGMIILTQEPTMLVSWGSFATKTFLRTQIFNSFLVAIVVFIPSLLSGMILPGGVIILKSHFGQAGRSSGFSYLINTLGAVLGGILAATWILPTLGLRSGFVSLGGVLGALSIFLYLIEKFYKRAFFYLAILGLVGFLAIKNWNNLDMASGGFLYGRAVLGPTSGLKMLSYNDGKEASVMAVSRNGVTMLRINGKVDASNDAADMGTQIVLGHIPAFLTAKPQKVLVIGLGSGITAGALAKHKNVEKLFVSEIEPEVVEVAKNYFSAENYRVLDNPKTHLSIGDGRNYLLTTDELFDIITSEPSNPWIAGEGNLFTKEFFELGKDRLTQDGVFFQWLYLYNLRPSEVKSIVKTFSEVFPYTQIWTSTNTVDLFLAGKKEPFILSGDRFRELLVDPGVGESLSRQGYDSEVNLLSLLLADDAKVRILGQDSVINSDLRPILEYRAPYGFHGNFLSRNFEMLLDLTKGDENLLSIEGLTKSELEKLDKAREARKFLVRARKTLVDGNLDASIQLAEEGYSIYDEPSLKGFLSELYRSKADDLPVSEATSYYEKAIEYSPNHYSSYLSLIQAYFAQKKKTEVEELIVQAKEKFPWSGSILMYEGILAGMVEDFPRSEELFLKARDLEPDNLVIYNNLANLYYQNGQKEKAVDTWRESLRINPNQPNIRQKLTLTVNFLKLR